MPDNDLAGNGWSVPQSRYVQDRPAKYQVPRPTSRYRTMRDGCRIAVDIYLPQGDGVEPRLPTILIQTPYYRRFAVAVGAQGVEPSPNVAKYRDMFVPRGYAVVIVDIRGSGASFGTRDSFRSPREREDAYEIVDWVIAQPWSNGSLGATGVSYLGAASDFLASTGHPAVKAIAPLFAVWDTYLDNYYPGGVLLTNLADVYDQLMLGLDHDQRSVLKQFAYYADPNYRGPQPVDDDTDGSECRAAVAEHAGNFRMPEFIGELEFRNQPLADRPELSSASISPSTYVSGTSPDVAVYSVSGWMDGAGYANGTISRYLTMPNRNKYLLLGPWDHGARINASPWRASETPEFNIYAEILRFFDEHLIGIDTGLRAEKPIHYFTVHEERWRAADAWPPIPEPTRYFFAENGTLAGAASPSGQTSDQDTYDVDFSTRTGQLTRYERIAAIDSRQYYTDWHGRDAVMLNYTSAALPHDAELTGHCELSLWLSSSAADFAVHAYISEILPDGQSHYVTEGLLRALHRKESEPPAHYRTSWSFHSCERADAQAMPIDVPQLLKFALLPISWTFKAGSRIRISFAGADADHCARIPADQRPRLKFLRGAERGSSVALPLRGLNT
jgi:putative CocE/NonD family hydrolase